MVIAALVIGSAVIGFVSALFMVRSIVRQHERDAPDVPTD